MVNLCKNRVRLGSQKIRVRLVAGTTLRGYDLTSIHNNIENLNLNLLSFVNSYE